MSEDRVSILCVDDNAATRYSMVRTLRLGGYEVAEASTGAEALRLAAAVPDLITLDVQLPDIDGFEVCRRLKANPDTAQVPILHVSAKPLPGHFECYQDFSTVSRALILELAR